MSKIYEALQLAQRERKGRESPAPAYPMPDRQSCMDSDIENQMYNIYQNINLSLPKHQRKVIQFLGALEGEGTSTIARLFARMASDLLGKSVLLLDADRSADRQRPGHDPLRDGRRADSAPGDDSGDDEIYRVGNSHLYLCTGSDRQGFSPRDIYTVNGKSFLEDLKGKFNLIFIDSMPAARSPDGAALAGRVDGVILVIEADRTRWPVVEKLKTQIVKNGGTIIGAVLNKRRYYIPEFLYKRL